MRYAIFAVALAIPLLSHAQEKADQPTAPATKLEAFSARTGTVVIKGYSALGSVSGGLGSVSIDVREFRDGHNPKSVQYGVAFEVKESGRLERENTSFIDEDEIDSLIRGSDYISKIGSNVTPFKEFEAHYKTKGDLSLIVFSGRGGETSFAVTSGRIGKTRAFLKLADIERIRSLLDEAKNQIASAKAKNK